MHGPPRLCRGALVWLLMLALLPSLSRAAFLDMPSIIDRPSLGADSPLQPVEIPEVKKRPSDQESGPHVLVYEIKLQGVKEYPKYGITKQAINELIENSRRKLMKADKLLESGFTTDEVGEIGNLLAQISENKRVDEISEEDVQQLVALVRDQINRRGLTLVQIETIAEQITMFYRERGFFLAKAYVPSQEVRDGVVGLVILEGDLGEIKVAGNKRYRDGIIEREFKSRLGKAVTFNETEERLYLINDYPGLEVNGYFKPGKQIGDTQLNINVKNEKRFSLSARLDNHGSDLTGKYRIYGEVLWHNPTGMADELMLGGLQSISPENSTYGVLRYKIPVFGSRNRFSIGATTNQFVLDQSALAELGNADVTGETAITDVAFEHHFQRGRKSNLSANLGYAKKESTLVLGNNAGTLGDDSLSVYSVGVQYDGLLEGLRLLNQVSATLSEGKLDKIGNLNPDDSFLKFSTNYSSLMFVPIPFTQARTRLILRGNGQYSGQVLPSLEQFSLAGAGAVRGYPINVFSADSAAYGGVDWVFNLPGALDFTLGTGMPLNQMLNPTLFWDASFGQQNPLPSSSASRVTLFGWGAGLEFNHKSGVSGHLQAARGISAKFTDSELIPPEDETRFLFDVQYKFK